MIRAPSILGLAGNVAPRELGRQIDRQRRLGREPTVTDLLPGALGASALKVCRDRGAAVATSEALVGREGTRRVDAESKALTDCVFEALDRDEVTGIVWHLYYWYGLRRLCLAAATLDAGLKGEVYAARVLGGDELLAGVLDQVCRRRGVLIWSPSFWTGRTPGRSMRITATPSSVISTPSSPGRKRSRRSP